MTKVVFLGLIVFFKLVLLAELPVVREKRPDELSNKREEIPIMSEFEKLTKVFEGLKEIGKVEEDLDAVRNKRRQDLEGFLGRLEEIKKQIGQNNDLSIETALNEIKNEDYKSENNYERKMSEIEKRISKLRKTKKSVQNRGDTDIERPDSKFNKTEEPVQVTKDTDIERPNE